MANTGSRHKNTPFPSVSWETLMDAHVQPPLIYNFSGELTSTMHKANMGPARKSGRVVDVWLSTDASGKDNTNQLRVSGEVFINGTSCLTTVPSIGHVSGEASQQKTTKVTGDTNITQAVIDTANNTFSPGDVFTATLTVNRTGSPTTEISNVSIVAEVEPFMASPED